MILNGHDSISDLRSVLGGGAIEQAREMFMAAGRLVSGFLMVSSSQINLASTLGRAPFFHGGIKSQNCGAYRDKETDGWRDALIMKCKKTYREDPKGLRRCLG
ncbi:hypothetical protein ACFSM5_03555 [Lacibacterium aquatile]|uniref:Uncharacterized protein n=1 Tax=Lacibacterium aquatile TaxID=1168082 RepID=A0ABW5DLZ5_9PROT